MTFPANCQDLSAENCKGYGELFTLRRGRSRPRKSGAWYTDAVKKILKAKTTAEKNALRTAQDEIEGLGSSDTDDYRFAELTVRFCLDKNGEEKDVGHLRP